MEDCADGNANASISNPNVVAGGVPDTTGVCKTSGLIMGADTPAPGGGVIRGDVDAGVATADAAGTAAGVDRPEGGGVVDNGIAPLINAIRVCNGVAGAAVSGRAVIGVKTKAFKRVC